MNHLYPQQVCFVVDDVAYAVQYCENQFGWGPFFEFKASLDDARYRDWQGKKVTRVALGMAGNVQVELLHVDCGRDSTADYQSQYGTGLQHIGISCPSREQAAEQLVALGAEINEANDYSGVSFAFMNVPTGPAMFELLQVAEQDNNSVAANIPTADRSRAKPFFTLDRATIVTDNMEQALAFYCAAFDWALPASTDAVLEIEGEQYHCQRFIGHAGTLELELIQPVAAGSRNPYAAHLQRGDHGLVHASGLINGDVFPGNYTTAGS